MDIKKTVVEITKAVIAANPSDANLDPVGAAEIAEFMTALEYSIEQMEQGKTREDVIKTLIPKHGDGFKQEQ